MNLTPTKRQLFFFTFCAIICKIIKPKQFRYASVTQIVDDLSSNMEKFVK